MDLCNLHSVQNPHQVCPPTYNQGSQLIDLCAGSPEFVDPLEAAWYLPFGLPQGLKGDHCTLGLDFAIDKLFLQQATTPYKVPTQGVYSNNTKLVEKFCTQVVKDCQEQGIYN